MVKRWKEIDEVIKPTIEIPKELWQLEEQMKEVPNFNKSQGSRKIFQRKEYSIYKASGATSYIIPMETLETITLMLERLVKLRV